MADLTVRDDALRAEIESGFRAVLASGRYVLGPNVAAFEREVAAYLGVRHAIGCASGTDALHLALRACGIGAGDEVVTTPFTFFGTVEAILHAGATPVFADIEPHGFNIDPAAVARLLTPRTRAVVPVHLFGHPADVPALSALAAQHGLMLIEDCAQAFGARIDGRRVGGFGRAAALSFFPSKNLGAFGDGGMVVTDCDVVAQRVRELGNHGSSVRYRHVRVGFNSRLDELQAVVLRARLRRLDADNAARRAWARRYNERLANLPGVTVPGERPGCEHVYAQYTIRVHGRDRLTAALQAAYIDSAVHYPVPMHRQPALAADYVAVSLPCAERAASDCLSLPMFPALGAGAVDRVAAVIADWARTRPVA